METVTLKNDVKVFCIAAESFPDGIMAAHEKIHALAPFSTERSFFGISSPDQSGIIQYKAAMDEIIKDELAALNLEEFVLKKGIYKTILVNDYRQNISAINEAFDTLIADPDIDPQGFCLEWYFNDQDVKCMVRLKE